MPADAALTARAGMAAVRRGEVEGRGLQNARGTFASDATLEALRRARAVWDYSADNVATLGGLDVAATHVPLGAAASWVFPDRFAATVAGSAIDVLFYGTLTPRRAAVLREIRSFPNPQAVYHANAATDGTFGRALDALVLNADVVLNLRTFGDGRDEWKMPRLAKLLANGRFVISEGACGAGDQCAPYRGGLVFAERPDLKAAVAYYASRPKLRARIAARGAALFANRSMADALKGPVQALLDAPRRRPPDAPPASYY